MRFQKYYNLEQYLFDEVGPGYRRGKRLEPIDLYLVLVWKANRAKKKTTDRLARQAGTFQKAAKAISKGLHKATYDQQRLQFLMKVWGFRLPTATALLSVLYPETFTVYDRRVCSELGHFEKIVTWQFSPRLWNQYRRFVAAVASAVPGRLSLRDKDRYLWGKSLFTGVIADLRLMSPAGQRAKRARP